MRTQGDTDYFSRRLRIGSFIGYFVIALLVSRVWYLQGVKGAYFRDLSENNRTRTIRILPPRGNIFDRHGETIVSNRPAFNVGVMLEDVKDVSNTLVTLADVTKNSVEEFSQRLKHDRSRLPFEPQLVLSDVSRETLAKVKVNTYRLPGVIVEAIPARSYKHPGVASQVLGYARQITREQLEGKRTQGYKQGDIVGHTGIEEVWEDALRGSHGYLRVEVDARGNRRQELELIDEAPGNDLHLTLDVEMQQAAQEALGELGGAVIALDVRTGGILVLASAPTFDGNLFSRAVAADTWKNLALSKEKPLRNRAISSIYPPGSTMKLLFGIAGLAEGIIKPETVFTCPGYYKFAGRRYHCHKRGGHGGMRLKEAITKSCNVYFYKLGQALGIDGITKYGSLFGFGEKSGVELNGEEAGVVPSRAFKLKRFGEQWYPGETLSVSIGQGYWSVTPMQMAVLMMGIANGGTLFEPYLVQKIVNPRTGAEEQFSAKIKRKIDLKPEHVEVIRQYASAVVNEEGGTGHRARLEGIHVAGKTGTAQVSKLKAGSIKSAIEDHAWFVSFAPAENPEIAVVVIAEHGGHGGVTAAPVARAVYESYFQQDGRYVPKAEQEVVQLSNTGLERVQF